MLGNRKKLIYLETIKIAKTHTHHNHLETNLHDMTSSEEFRVFGKAMIDYVADYLEVRDNVQITSFSPDVE